jgi:hypothetical protein
MPHGGDGITLVEAGQDDASCHCNLIVMVAKGPIDGPPDVSEMRPITLLSGIGKIPARVLAAQSRHSPSKLCLCRIGSFGHRGLNLCTYVHILAGPSPSLPENLETLNPCTYVTYVHMSHMLHIRQD